MHLCLFFFFLLPRVVFSPFREILSLMEEQVKSKRIRPSRLNFPCDTQERLFSFPCPHCQEFCFISWVVLDSSISSLYLTALSALHFQASTFLGFVAPIVIVS